MTTQQTPLEQAIAAEVRAEMARQQVSAASIQESADMASKSFRRYFVECSTRIPLNAVSDVAAALGLTLTEVVARAERGPSAQPVIHQRNGRDGAYVGHVEGDLNITAAEERPDEND